MRDAEAFVNEMFSLPGDPDCDPGRIIEKFARAVERLLDRAVRSAPEAGELLERISDALRRPDVLDFRDDFLSDPVVVESLHRLTAHIPDLDRWHRQVAVPSVAQLEPETEATLPAQLGNLLLPLAWRADPEWCGTLSMRSDLYGHVRFPMSHWSLWLAAVGGPPDAVLSREPVRLRLGRERVEWALGVDGAELFHVMTREDCRGAFVENRSRLAQTASRGGRPPVRASLSRATPMGRGTVGYVSIHSAGQEGFARQACRILEQVLTAIDAHSPVISREFSRLMRVVRGFASAGGPRGTIQSFSDPTEPRVMNINVASSETGEPLLSPFGFTWFGHELGHTRMYLIDAIAYCAGLRFVTNAETTTGRISRYGRPLSVRTVFQVPYVHLYEWTLLMDLLQAGFRDLPGKMTDNPQAAGDDLEREIAEAFPLIAEYARLTPVGAAAVGRFQELFETLRTRWKSLRGID